MSERTRTETPADEPVLIMSRIYDAPRALVWEAVTRPEHVRQWWGGKGASNPVCEMDVRPQGLWTHVLRFADGREIHMKFVFIEVVKPERLVWTHADAPPAGGPPSAQITVTLEALGQRTRWKMVARFASVAERDAAVSIGFGGPIEASSDRLVGYLRQGNVA